MDTPKKNKEFIVKYLADISGIAKTRELCLKYMTDEELLGHIIFFDAVFPKYEIIIDELMAEGDRVVARAWFKGRHMGEFNSIPPTHKDVMFPFVISYDIKDEIIVKHWLLVDQVVLLEQLGVMKKPAMESESH